MYCSFCQAQGNLIGYYPNTPLHLGAGFLIGIPSEPKLPFLKPYATDSQNWAGQTNILFTIVTNNSSLRSALNISSYLSVSDIGYSVDATFGLDENSFYGSNSVTLALNATTDFGSVYITNPVPDDTAQKYINSQNWSAFINAYGDNFVNQYERGVSVSLFLTISNLSSNQKSILNGSFSGSVVGLGSAGASFNSAIRSASNSGNLSIQIKSNGAGFAGLSDLIKAASANVDAVDSIKNAFSDYMKRFTIADAQATGFNYEPMNNFKVNAVNNTLLPAKVSKLTAIFNNYYDVVGKASLLNDIITGSTPNSKYYQDFHNGSDSLEAIRLAKQYQFAEDSLANAHKACLANPCSDLVTCCSNPIFTFNPAFFNKFLNLPFNSCLNNNPQWWENYANKTFTFTSAIDTVIFPGQGQTFYNCTSTNPTLASNIVTTSFSGTVYNFGGYTNVGGSYWVSDFEFQETMENFKIKPYQKNMAFGYTTGNKPVSWKYTDTIGADGVISFDILLNVVNATSQQALQLNKGAIVSFYVPNPIPSIDAIITPSDAIICLGNSVTLSANTCKGCSYLWNTGDTTQNISVKNSGNYTVNVSNSSSSTNSYWSTITINQPPVTPIITTENGSTTVCQGTPITASSTGCIGCTYTWSPGGQTGPSKNINSGGVYGVTASNGCSPAATSQQITIAIDQPPIPTFTITGHYLKANIITGATYQWFLNDKPINGATSSIYIFDSTGFYSLGIIDANGCSAISNSDTLLNRAGINGPSLSQQLNIYPNPSNGIFTLFFKNINESMAAIEIYDEVGHSIYRSKLNSGNNKINLSSQPAGVYHYKVLTENGENIAIGNLVIE